MAKKKDPVQKEKDDKPPIVYRDGFGNIIEDEDLKLREKLNKELMNKFSRRIEYEGTFRAGTIIYRDNESTIKFYHEMGGGNCMFYIDVPPESEWEKQTQTPLSRRKEILEYVAETVRVQQASNCYFEIKEKEIGFYYK
ncbi:MAG: hypothetical protein HZB42_07225 [Sphingobacteriales bacterium]|nr:hypothetical protein [Sphingobacteriales bacterium]